MVLHYPNILNKNARNEVHLYTGIQPRAFLIYFTLFAVRVRGIVMCVNFLPSHRNGLYLSRGPFSIRGPFTQEQLDEITARAESEKKSSIAAAPGDSEDKYDDDNQLDNLVHEEELKEEEELKVEEDMMADYDEDGENLEHKLYCYILLVVY